MAHEFGNIDTWTGDKLGKVKAYLDAYLTALKNENFQLEYIDAFAGTGYVNKPIVVKGETLFDAEETIQLKSLIDGSARIALQTEIPFARYIFIEQHRIRCKELERLKEEFPERTIDIIHGDANTIVQELCNANWIAQRRRGVMFLDPYGTQVSWKTIEAIAATKAIDLWILFPIGTVNRLLNRNGKIKDARKRRLDHLFGDTRWFDCFYEKDHTGSLLPESDEMYVKTASPFDTITKYFLDRLKDTFAGVAENPFVMKNSTNSQIFLLCFSAGNPKGAPIALRIATYILGKD